MSERAEVVLRKQWKAPIPVRCVSGTWSRDLSEQQIAELEEERWQAAQYVLENIRCKVQADILEQVWPDVAACWPPHRLRGVAPAD